MLKKQISQTFSHNNIISSVQSTLKLYKSIWTRYCDMNAMKNWEREKFCSRIEWCWCFTVQLKTGKHTRKVCSEGKKIVNWISIKWKIDRKRNARASKVWAVSRPRKTRRNKFEYEAYGRIRHFHFFEQLLLHLSPANNNIWSNRRIKKHSAVPSLQLVELKTP